MKLVVHYAEPTDPAEHYGPLVCECHDSDADPARDFGMCSTCKRKPLALMAVAS